MNKKRNDIILISIFVLAAVALLLFQFLGRSKGENTRITVTLNNEAILKGRIYEDAGQIIKNADYVDLKYISYEDNKLMVMNGNDYNVLVTETEEDGRIGIRCIDANCKDHVCMDVGLTSSEENPIVCLPHKLSVRVIRTE
ncbi:MAG: NusG domain II-containing protein [Eubacteriales bacterium]|nr:NusG domain II-containing protein [Eubacteriales bacterium]